MTATVSRSGMRRAALALIQKHCTQRNAYFIRRSKDSKQTFSSWTEIESRRHIDLQKAVTEVINSPIGSVDEEGWENIDHVMRRCCREEGSVKLSFDLLHRIANEGGPDSTTSFNPLNTAILNWRNQYTKNQVTTPSPRAVVEMINDLREKSTLLQPDAKSYTMIIEASSKDDKEGLFFSETLLEWMLEESKKNILIQPTTVTFAAVSFPPFGVYYSLSPKFLLALTRCPGYEWLGDE